MEIARGTPRCLLARRPRAGRLFAEVASAAICGLGIFWFASRAYAADPWRIPAEGECEATDAGTPRELDAVPFPFRKGDVVDKQKAETLGPFLPEELWQNRDRFLFDGMQLEVGPCYRDYRPPEFFEQATQRFRGQVGLGASGELENYQAGLPFAPDTIDPQDPQAALRWAWNWVNRYEGAGSFGDVRLMILARELLQRFEGSFFHLRLLGRADRASDGYRYPAPLSVAWAAGGETQNLDTGSVCKFRQYATGARRPDLFYWAAQARKVIRGISPDSEGPFIGCLADASVGGDLLEHGESPQLHDWKLLGVRDLLAPINARVPAYPDPTLRDFGPFGVSWASDRWELRRVIVLEGRFREGSFADGVRRFIWYLDLQTLVPLYYAAYREDGSQGGIGYFVGRWSEDRDDYPRWPDDPQRPVRVIDSVGSALVDLNDLDAVRHESWNAVSVPRDEKRLPRMLSQSGLRGH